MDDELAEIDTTEEEFDAMWARAGSVHVPGYYAKVRKNAKGETETYESNLPRSCWPENLEIPGYGLKDEDRPQTSEELALRINLLIHKSQAESR